MLNAEFGGAGEGEVVGVEGDGFGVVVNAEGGDDEVKRAGGETGSAALLAEVGGIAPKTVRSGKERQGFKLGSNPFLFLGSGVAEASKAMGSQRQASGSRIHGWIKVLRASGDLLRVKSSHSEDSINRAVVPRGFGIGNDPPLWRLRSLSTLWTIGR